MRNRSTALVAFLVFFPLIFSCTSDPQGGRSGGGSEDASPSSGDLVRAVVAKDATQVETLLSNGAYINENVGTAEHQITPLMVAVALDHKDIAALLVRKGASLYPNYRGYSAKDLSFHLYGSEDSLTLQMRRQK